MKFYDALKEITGLENDIGQQTMFEGTKRRPIDLTIHDDQRYFMVLHEYDNQSHFTV